MLGNGAAHVVAWRRSSRRSPTRRRGYNGPRCNVSSGGQSGRGGAAVRARLAARPGSARSALQPRQRLRGPRCDRRGTASVRPCAGDPRRSGSDAAPRAALPADTRQCRAARRIPAACRIRPRSILGSRSAPGAGGGADQPGGSSFQLVLLRRRRPRPGAASTPACSSRACRSSRSAGVRAPPGHGVSGSP